MSDIFSATGSIPIKMKVFLFCVALSAISLDCPPKFWVVRWIVRSDFGLSASDFGLSAGLSALILDCPPDCPLGFLDCPPDCPHFSGRKMEGLGRKSIGKERSP